MKRIEFIAPVDAMRGNLSGSQDINYGANDGRAYDQEVGKQTAANNYDPRFVGAKRGRDGLKYFQVRTKNTIGLTQKSKTAMALLGGASACFIAASRDLSILTKLQAAFVAATESDKNLTFRKWLQGILYEMLALGQDTVTISSSVGDVVIKNPWLARPAQEGTDLNISNDILVKFWSILASTGAYEGFTVKLDGVTWVGQINKVSGNPKGTWSTVITGTKWGYNAYEFYFDIMQQMNAYAQMTTDASQAVTRYYMRKGSPSGAYAKVSDLIDFGGDYFLTEEAPA